MENQTIDTGIFSRLQRLFSTDVIIRNVGGNQIKTVDVNKMQSTGGLKNNSPLDTFNRVHVTGWGSTYELNNAFQRNTIYSDYELMDTDAIVASVLDIVADESTLKNDQRELLSIQSTNENIQRILYNLFYDILNIEFNLWSWIRTMAKYGDCFIHLSITEELGITNAHYLPPYNVDRLEGMDPNNPSVVKFQYVENSQNLYVNSQSKKKEYENYEMAHFRLISDTNFLPYGRSYVEPARKAYKAMVLMEDAMLIHRIMRSPEKRIFYVNVGSIPPNEVDNFMEKMMNKVKKIPYIDPQTGDYNLKFNMQNIIEDFYIPVRGNDQTTRIDTAKGLEFAGMEDVEYFRDKVLAALKVPKAFLGYSEDTNGKATLAAMDIRFARTIERIQKIVLSELTKIAMIHLYVQGYKDADLVNFELDLTPPSIIYEQERIELMKSKVDLVAAMADQKLFSSDWIYSKIFGLSEDQWNSEKEKIVVDAMYQFRLTQITEEGNDPIETGESYGTPHDLATIYKANSEVGGAGNVPPGYNEDKPALSVGRPQTSSTNYSTQASNMGVDPIGKKEVGNGGNLSETSNFVNKAMLQTLRRSGLKKLSIKPNTIRNMLSEENIKDV